jgi:hypothetical protein
VATISENDSFSEPGTYSGGSVVTKSRSKRMVASAKSFVSSGATLAGNVGSSLAAAATAAATAAASATLTSLPRLLWDTPPPARAQLPATLKQELVCTLLTVLSQHPAAAAALQLPPGKPVPPPTPSAAAAAAAGGPSRTLSRLTSGPPQQQQQQGVTALPSAAGAVTAAAANGDAASSPVVLGLPTADGAAAAAAAAANGDAASSPVVLGLPTADGAAAAAAADSTVAALQSPQQQQQQQVRQFGLDDVSTSPIVASLQAQVGSWSPAPFHILHNLVCRWHSGCCFALLPWSIDGVMFLLQGRAVTCISTHGSCTAVSRLWLVLLAAGASSAMKIVNQPSLRMMQL